jgi:hypothetical protein
METRNVIVVVLIAITCFLSLSCEEVWANRSYWSR